MFKKMVIILTLSLSLILFSGCGLTTYMVENGWNLDYRTYPVTRNYFLFSSSGKIVGYCEQTPYSVKYFDTNNNFIGYVTSSGKIYHE